MGARYCCLLHEDTDGIHQILPVCLCQVVESIYLSFHLDSILDCMSNEGNKKTEP